MKIIICENLFGAIGTRFARGRYCVRLAQDLQRSPFGSLGGMGALGGLGGMGAFSVLWAIFFHPGKTPGGPYTTSRS